MSHPTPIIGRDALLSLVDWGNTMRRQQDERTMARDSEPREDASGGPQAACYGAVNPNDSPTADSEPSEEHGGRGKEEA